MQKDLILGFLGRCEAELKEILHAIDENEQINFAVALSGLTKQEYCIRRCLNRDVIVQGNPRVYKALRSRLAAVLDELKRIESSSELRDELLDNIALITRTLGGMKEETE